MYTFGRRLVGQLTQTTREPRFVDDWLPVSSVVRSIQRCGRHAVLPTIIDADGRWQQSLHQQRNTLVKQQTGERSIVHTSSREGQYAAPTNALYPRSARLVGLPLTVRERSTRASICRSNTPASISQAKKFQLRQPENGTAARKIHT